MDHPSVVMVLPPYLFFTVSKNKKKRGVSYEPHDNKAATVNAPCAAAVCTRIIYKPT